MNPVHLLLFLLPALTGPEKASPVLSLKWEISSLKTPESVLHDPVRNVLYISNIHEKPAEKDYNGFISKVSVTGEVIDINWVSNLSAPKGMGLFGTTLYVTDIDVVVAIDVNTGKSLNSWTVEGAKFLNDIAVDETGHVFVSDSRANKIFRLTPEGTFSLFSADSLLAGPNGLHFVNKQLKVGTQRGIVSLDAKGKATIEVPNAKESIDGIAWYNGGYFTSDWQGKTQWIAKGREPVVMLNTTAEKINSADFEYIPSLNLLIIPTFFDNRVRAYQVSGK